MLSPEEKLLKMILHLEHPVGAAKDRLVILIYCHEPDLLIAAYRPLIERPHFHIKRRFPGFFCIGQNLLHNARPLSHPAQCGQKPQAQEPFPARLRCKKPKIRHDPGILLYHPKFLRPLFGYGDGPLGCLHGFPRWEIVHIIWGRIPPRSDRLRLGQIHGFHSIHAASLLPGFRFRAEILHFCHRFFIIQPTDFAGNPFFIGAQHSAVFFRTASKGTAASSRLSRPRPMGRPGRLAAQEPAQPGSPPWGSPFSWRQRPRGFPPAGGA